MCGKATESMSPLRPTQDEVMFRPQKRTPEVTGTLSARPDMKLSQGCEHGVDASSGSPNSISQLHIEGRMDIADPFDNHVHIFQESFISSRVLMCCPARGGGGGGSRPAQTSQAGNIQHVMSANRDLSLGLSYTRPQPSGKDTSQIHPRIPCQRALQQLLNDLTSTNSQQGDRMDRGMAERPSGRETLQLHPRSLSASFSTNV